MSVAHHGDKVRHGEPKRSAEMFVLNDLKVVNLVGGGRGQRRREGAAGDGDGEVVRRGSTMDSLCLPCGRAMACPAQHTSRTEMMRINTST